MNYNNKLRDLQLLLLDILIVIDKICKENDINYWLDGGTLLGAIRHNGFIPWDDDIDIVMPRKDYIKFKKIAKNELPSGLILEMFSEKSSLNYSWMKVRHKYSFIKESGIERSQSHNGIFIDIFPVDIYNKKSKILKQKNIYNLIHKLIISERQRMINPFIKNLHYNKKIIIKRINTILLNNLTKEKLYKKLYLKANKKFNSKDDGKIGDIIDYGLEIPMYCLKIKYEDVFPIKKHLFEGKEFNIPNNYDNYLKKLYGNYYMKLPEKDKQIWHNETFYIYKKSLD